MHAGWVYPKVSRAPKRRRVELPTVLESRNKFALLANGLLKYLDYVKCNLIYTFFVLCEGG